MTKPKPFKLKTPGAPGHVIRPDDAVYIRVPYGLKERLALAAELTGETQAAIARRGIQAELDRLLTPAGLAVLNF